MISICDIDYSYWFVFAIKCITVLNLILETLIYFTIHYSTTSLFYFIIGIISTVLNALTHIFEDEFKEYGYSLNLSRDVKQYLVKIFNENSKIFEIYNLSFSKIVSTGLLIYLCYRSTKKFIKIIKEIREH